MLKLVIAKPETPQYLELRVLLTYLVYYVYFVNCLYFKI